jgi:hypothetical protein
MPYLGSLSLMGSGVPHFTSSDMAFDVPDLRRERRAAKWQVQHFANDGTARLERDGRPTTVSALTQQHSLLHSLTTVGPSHSSMLPSGVLSVT